MRPLAFVVHGVPIPKGSTKAFLPRGWKRPIVTADNAKSKPWQEAVTMAALVARGDEPPTEGPVSVELLFFLPRPKSAPRRVVVPLHKPDVDKLARACLDGLTRAGVYRDDSQVVSVLAQKAFAAGERDRLGAAGVPRAEVVVHPVAAAVQGRLIT